MQQTFLVLRLKLVWASPEMVMATYPVTVRGWCFEFRLKIPGQGLLCCPWRRFWQKWNCSRVSSCGMIRNAIAGARRMHFSYISDERRHQTKAIAVAGTRAAHAAIWSEVNGSANIRAISGSSRTQRAISSSVALRPASRRSILSLGGLTILIRLLRKFFGSAHPATQRFLRCAF